MFGTLYSMELKKILGRPYVILLLIAMVGVTLFLNLYPLLEQEDVVYVEEDGTLIFDTVSHYQAVQLERRFAREDAGALLDNEAALEMQEMNQSYQGAGGPGQPSFFLLLNHFLVSDAMRRIGINPLFDGTDAPADFTYRHMAASQVGEYYAQDLTQEEMAYWEEERAGITTPFILDYAEGYSGILSLSYWLNLMALPFVFICLCDSFSNDRTYKTRPILTSCKNGRRSLALARLAAGESLAGGTILLLFGLTAALQFFVHGAQGASVPIQLLRVENLRPGYEEIWMSESSRAMTAGQGVLVTIGMSLLILLFAGALAMFLSQLFSRAVPALALPLGVLLLSLLFEPPFHSYNRVQAQIWSYFPIQRLSGEFLLDERLISLGGVQLESITVSVWLYGLLALLALLLCFWLYHIHAVERE